MFAMTSSRAARTVAGIRVLGSVAALTALSVGCSVYRPTDDRADRGAHVAIELRRPRTVPVVTSARDTLLLPDVVELRGYVDWATPDTVYVRLTGASVPSGTMQRVPVNGLVAVERTPDIQILKRELHAGRTAVFIIGATAAVALFFVGAFLVSLATFDGY